MHLYQTLMNEHKDLQRPENQVIEASDTVQSLPAKSCTKEDNRWAVTFDLTPISKGDELRLVELRVLLPPFKTPTPITMEIFHTENAQDRIFLGSIMESMPVSHRSAWKSFNMTNMMGQYLQRGNKIANYKDIHAVENANSAAVSHSGNPKKSINNEIPLHKKATNQAIIVFFSKDKPFSKPESPGLIKKLAESSPKMAGFRRQRRNRNRQIITPSITHFMTEVKQGPLCRKVDMMVEFKDLGYDNWVIYPKKYNAYRCEGSCRTPLKGIAKTTNYNYVKVRNIYITTSYPHQKKFFLFKGNSIFIGKNTFAYWLLRHKPGVKNLYLFGSVSQKSLINLKEWERAECSSCVPVKMQPLVMMFHEESNLILRHHEDMIIEECGAL
ncbi:nodal homolog 3-A-like [Lithobates pipiens]